jgi:hypothetical protein
MPTVSYNKVNQFVEDLAKGVHNFTAGSTTLRVMLTTNAASSFSVKSNFTEIAASGGYTSGGNSASIAGSAQTGGTYKLTLGSPAQWSASASTFPSFQYAVLYNDTATNDPVIGYWNYGSAVTLGNGETFDVVFDGTNGVLQIS